MKIFRFTPAAVLRLIAAGCLMLALLFPSWAAVLQAVAGYYGYGACWHDSGDAGAPTGCVAQVNGVATGVQLPSSGGNANLTVTGCTASSIITYNWCRNGTPGASAEASWTDTPALNPLLGPNTSGTTIKASSYQVQACAGSACVVVPANPLPVVVLPAGAVGGGDGGGGSGSPPPQGSGSTAQTAIPTISVWGLAMLCLLLVAATLLQRKRANDDVE
jgi:hypothetical protein